jgi:hypothetical protein
MPFKQRLEFGWNFQQTPGRNSFPATNDVGLSLGYQFSRKGTLGIGAAYRFGLGSWDKITLTHEGMGLRSYIDYRLSKPEARLLENIWITGSFEMNYWQRIYYLNQYRHLAWQASGLLGLTKKVKTVKGQMKMQVMVDLLAIRKNSVGDCLQFRMGKYL